MSRLSNQAVPASRLFTGASVASRLFELGVLVAALVVGGRTVFTPPLVQVPDLHFTGLVGGLAAATAVGVVVLAGVFPLPFNSKITLSLGSGAIFATLLVFPPYEALPLAFAGTKGH